MCESAKQLLRGRLKYFFLLMILLGFQFIVGCSLNASPGANTESPGELSPSTENQQDIQSYLADLPVLQPSIITVLTSNPVTIEVKSSDYSSNLYRETIMIRGLLDQNVENKINKTLTETYARIEEGIIPPYRGIYQVIPKGTPVTQVDYYTYPSFNFEQVLSVVINANLVYDNTAEEKSYSTFLESSSVGVTECLNFDLRSGREILLPEIFADPLYAMKYINDAVADVLASESYNPENIFYSSPILTSAFKGLNVNQKYYLTETGINLVIDYMNPEFDVYYYPAQIHLPFNMFDGKLALDGRFAADASQLYREPERTEYQLVYRDAQPGSEPIRFTDNFQSGDIAIFVRLYYPDQLPGSIMERINNSKEKIYSNIDDLQALTPIGGSLEGVNRFYDYTLILNCRGQYYSLRENIFSYGFELEYFYIDHQTYTGEGIPLMIENCFKPNYDYKDAIYSAYLEQYSLYEPEQPVTKEQLFELIRFVLESTGLEFILYNQQTYMTYFIPYQEFGFENLAIF